MNEMLLKLSCHQLKTGYHNGKMVYVRLIATTEEKLVTQKIMKVVHQYKKSSSQKKAAG